MQAHNGHHLPSLFRASSSDDDEGGYDPWNDPRFHNDAPVHRGRVPIIGDLKGNDKIAPGGPTSPGSDYELKRAMRGE